MENMNLISKVEKEKVIFLDRDGTINTEVNYLYKPEELVIIDGVAEAVKKWRADGFKIVVITNQAGVARGYYTEEDVNNLHEYLNNELKKQGACIDKFIYCPHHPENGIGEYKKDCECRKPKPGMFHMAEEYFNIDKAHSYMIGDKLADTQAGHNYGIVSILVGSGYGAMMKEKGSTSDYDFYAEALCDAVEWIENREA